MPCPFLAVHRHIQPPFSGLYDASVIQYALIMPLLRIHPSQPSPSFNPKCCVRFDDVLCLEEARHLFDTCPPPAYTRRNRPASHCYVRLVSRLSKTVGRTSLRSTLPPPGSGFRPFDTCPSRMYPSQPTLFYSSCCVRLIHAPPRIYLS